MIACHCHFTEEQIDNFGYMFYKDILFELGAKFKFESISNLYGNSYVGESYEQISEANPFNYKDEKQKQANRPKPTLGLMKNFGLI